MRTEGLASALQGQTLEDTACSIQIIPEFRAESRDQDKANKRPVQGQSWISGRSLETGCWQNLGAGAGASRTDTQGQHCHLVSDLSGACMAGPEPAFEV